jgi:hypothetical protein
MWQPEPAIEPAVSGTSQRDDRTRIADTRAAPSFGACPTGFVSTGTGVPGAAAEAGEPAPSPSIWRGSALCQRSPGECSCHTFGGRTTMFLCAVMFAARPALRRECAGGVAWGVERSGATGRRVEVVTASVGLLERHLIDGSLVRRAGLTPSRDRRADCLVSLRWRRDAGVYRPSAVPSMKGVAPCRSTCSRPASAVKGSRG